MKSYESYLGNTYWVKDDSFAHGGEGAIYEVHNYYNTVVKIYNSSKRTSHQESKLKSMLEVQLDDDVRKQFAWPIDIIYDKGKFVGFVMARIQGVPLNIINSDKYKDMPLGKKITIAKNLCAVVNNLHETGNVVGDMNPNNILVMPSTGLVRLIDCDSFHITDSKNRTYRCEVAMSEYLAPSVATRISNGENLKTAHLPTFTRESDCFSLAIHIFQLLMNSSHPFALAIDGAKNKKSVVLPQPSENMRNGLFPYDNCPEGYKLPIYAIPFEVLPEKIRKLFIKQFSDGETVYPHEWFDALSEYEKRLKQCKSNHNHEFRKGLRKCPYCTATTNTSRMLATGAMPKTSPNKTKSKKHGGSSKFLFWTITLALAIAWQFVGCHLVGWGDRIICDVASFIGFSYSGLCAELLNLNCACGLIAAFIYNCIVSRRKVKFKDYCVSQIFAILGFAFGFIIYSSI